MQSIISDLFFGFMKRKRICQVCKHGTYTISNFCFVPFDLTKSDYSNIRIFDIIQNGFDWNHNKEIVLDKNKYHVFCDRCLTEQNHYEFNRFYSMSYYLMIYFYRGNNYENNIKINIPNFLNIEKYVDTPNLSSKFNLVGSINRDISNGKEEFIYFSIDPNKNNYWRGSYGERNEPINPMYLMQNKGKIIMLFYTYAY